MRKLLAGLLLLATALPAGAQEASGGGLELQLGAEDFRIYCSSCHGVDGKGLGPVAEYLTLKPADLTGLARREGGKFPAELVARIIDGRSDVKAHGPRDMPVWGNYFRAEQAKGSAAVKEEDAQARIAALVAYVASLQAR